VTGFARNRDVFAGLLIALIGAGAIAEGWQLGIGGLSNMGSGFFPVMLGAALVLLGGVMAVIHAPAPAGHHAASPDWRGAAAIALAVVLFVLLADNVGLLPAIFACVFVAALGTRITTLKEALLLAAGVTIFGIGLFSYVLKVPFPILRGVLN
jgi:hypothetical protein